MEATAKFSKLTKAYLSKTKKMKTPLFRYLKILKPGKPKWIKRISQISIIHPSSKKKIHHLSPEKNPKFSQFLKKSIILKIRFWVKNAKMSRKIWNFQNLKMKAHNYWIWRILKIIMNFLMKSSKMAKLDHLRNNYSQQKKKRSANQKRWKSLKMKNPQSSKTWMTFSN